VKNYLEYIGSIRDYDYKRQTKKTDFLMIDNMLLESLYLMKLSGPEFKTMIYLIRRTHGETGMNKKGDWLLHTIKSQRDVARFTGQNQSQISKAIMALGKLNLLEIVSSDKPGIMIRLNMRLDKWASDDVKAHVTKWIETDIKRREDTKKRKLQKEADKQAKAEKKRLENLGQNNLVSITDSAERANVTRGENKLSEEDKALLADLAEI